MQKLGNNLDAAKNQIVNLLAHIINGDPGAPTEGQIWYDSGAKKFKFRSNTANVDPTDRAQHTGTQAASTISDFAEAVSDQLGTMVTGNTETGIVVTYQDGDNTLDFELDDEWIEDLVAAMFTDSATFDFVYNDAAGTITGTVLDSPTLGGQNSAFHLSRANHTGTQLAATISDLAATVKAYRLDEFADPNSDIPMAGVKFTGLGAPSSPNDSATKAYVDATAQGLTIKAAVEARATANVNIANPGTNTFDGVVVANGEAVALFDQTTDSEKGIYVFNGNAVAMTRRADADAFAELDAGTKVFVQGGATHGGKEFVQLTELTAFTGQSWTQSGSGTTYVAGAGLAESPAGTFNVGAHADGSITVAADTIQVTPGFFTKKVGFTIGNGAATAIVLNHALNTRDVHVAIYDAATYEEVITDVVHTDANNVTLNFAVAPANNSLRAVVIG